MERSKSEHMKIITDSMQQRCGTFKKLTTNTQKASKEKKKREKEKQLLTS